MSLSLIIIFSLSTNEIFSLLTNLLESIGLHVFRNFQLSITFFFVFLNGDAHKFLCFQNLCLSSSSLLLFSYLFLKFGLFIISLLRVLFINGTLLPLMDFFYKKRTYLKCFDKFSSY